MVKCHRKSIATLVSNMSGKLEDRNVSIEKIAELLEIDGKQ